MKRDINFIKHIKAEVKEKERKDKTESRLNKYDKACKSIGLDPPGINVEDLGGILSMLKRFKP
jgi:hypothetical protein